MTQRPKTLRLWQTAVPGLSFATDQLDLAGEISADPFAMTVHVNQESGSCEAAISTADSTPSSRCCARVQVLCAQGTAEQFGSLAQPEESVAVAGPLAELTRRPGVGQGEPDRSRVDEQLSRFAVAPGGVSRRSSVLRGTVDRAFHGGDNVVESPWWLATVITMPTLVRGRRRYLLAGSTRPAGFPTPAAHQPSRRTSRGSTHSRICHPRVERATSSRLD